MVRINVCACVCVVFLSLRAALTAQVKTDAGEAFDKELQKHTGTSLLETIVSCRQLALKGPDEKKWSFTMGGWYERKLGNTDSMRANGTESLNYDDNIREFELSYSYFYGKFSGVENENRGTGTARFDHIVLNRWEVFVFSLVDHNRIIGLNIRSGTGTGIKFVMFRNKYWKMDLSGAPVYEYEDYSTLLHRNEFRASFRYRVKVSVGSLTSLNFTYFYVPVIDNFRNYRTTMDANISFSITPEAIEKGGLILKGGYQGNYNTFALPGKKKNDQILYAQAQLKI